MNAASELYQPATHPARIGKLRCEACGEHIANHAADRAAHTRQHLISAGATIRRGSVLDGNRPLGNLASGCSRARPIFVWEGD